MDTASHWSNSPCYVFFHTGSGASWKEEWGDSVVCPCWDVNSIEGNGESEKKLHPTKYI